MYGNLLGTKVSIHASVKDATGGIGSAYIRSRFNPRICKRCDDTLGIIIFLILLFQSTHL